MNYIEISKETISLLHKSYASLSQSPLKQTLRTLVELRVSQINGCKYCIGLHTQEAKKLNIPLEKINTLHTWCVNEMFSPEERAALHWAETLTHLDKDLNEAKVLLTPYFNDREIVDLTACIAIMNALNRLAISFKA